MVRIVIDTQGEDDHRAAVAPSAVPASGDDADGGAGPGGGDADFSAAPSDSADGGAPPGWLVSAIEAAERGEGQSGPPAGTDGAEDGGAAPEM